MKLLVRRVLSFCHVTQFSALSNVDIVPADISLAGRVLAAFPEKLSPEQRVPDNLAYLGQLALEPTASIIKLPNISAPLNQLQDCIKELRNNGYDVPLYPTEPSTPEDVEIQQRYGAIMGSAVNPVLREGNSDRRVAPPVKAYAQKNPHRMGLWSKASRTHVAHMTQGDFYGSEQSVCLAQDTSVTIELHHTNQDGTVQQQQVLKAGIPMLQGEVMDAATMSISELEDFYEQEIEDAKESGMCIYFEKKMRELRRIVCIKACSWF